MRKLYLISIVIFATWASIQAQYRLSADKNAFLSGNKHEFVFATALAEGNAGKNVTWDFSGLQIQQKTLTTNMSMDVSAYSDKIPNANLVIEEAGNLFFFKVTSKGMEQYGSVGGNVVTRYDKPITKLKFPFKYGETIAGDYAGVTINANATESKISGTYEVVADAYGTLLLPGDAKIANVLRVKQTRTFANSDLKEITYRWYSEVTRYPLLVVVKYQSANNVTLSQTALYKNYRSVNQDKVIENVTLNEGNLHGVKLTPNPATENFKVEYSINNASRVKFEIIDATGKVLKTDVISQSKSGTYVQSLSVSRKNTLGIYFVKVSTGNDAVTQKLILQ